MRKKIIVYLCLGGGETNMSLRLQKLINKYKTTIQNQYVIWIVTGLSTEIQYMKKILQENGIHNIVCVVSYDTVTNLSKTKRIWKDAKIVYFSTSDSHGKRVLSFINDKSDKKVFSFIESGEEEIKNAKIIEYIYKYKIGRKFLQIIAFVLRYKQL